MPSVPLETHEDRAVFEFLAKGGSQAKADGDIGRRRSVVIGRTGGDGEGGDEIGLGVGMRGLQSEGQRDGPSPGVGERPGTSRSARCVFFAIKFLSFDMMVLHVVACCPCVRSSRGRCPEPNYCRVFLLCGGIGVSKHG